MKRAALRIAGLATLLLGTLAMAIEKPKHEVLKQYPDFEVRGYPAYVVAETEVQGDQTDVSNEAFSRLAGYIFGKNHGARKIAMTAPVTQAPAEGAKIAMTAPVTQASTGPRSWRVQFMMPSEYSLETLPEPNDERVHLRLVEPARFAVIRYSGTWSRQNYDENLALLEAALKREGVETRGEPVWARYDPPFMPWFLRTNEILIEVGP
jgi:hypothetical protein